ncbi:MAG: DEAD/DEAH box helicase [Candidatus Nanopelagicales bacterium]
MTTTAPVVETDLLSAAHRVITALAGPGAEVRPDQLDAVRALVVERRRALVVQATGWGKSAVYWIAARAVRDAGGGPVLVVSPLLALMGDQVAAAQRAGLRAATMNSSNLDDWGDIERAVLAGEVDVLLVSPERLANPRFAAGVLEVLLPRLGLLVIDEAHCISSWGHDFRPDYQRIAGLLLANPGLPVLATTATANARVTADVAAQLGPDTFVQRGRLARESLHLGVLPGLSAVARYAWIDEALHALPRSGIVYCLTVADAERLTSFLATRGHDVAAYTGRTEPQERVRVEAALRANEVKAVVATSALGMGYDKPDLAFCLHVGSPGSPVDYYQQVGRAGRALDSAVVVLLPSEADARLWEWFATASVPVPDEAAAVLRTLDQADGACSVPELESATGVRRSRVELLVKVLAVDGAVERTVDGWRATGEPWSYDHEKYAELVAARRRESDLMRVYAQGGDCLDVLLRRALDDPTVEGERCGRCSVCTGSLPGSLPTQPSSDAVGAARDWLRARDTELEPRKMWTSGIGDAASRPWKGRIGLDVASSRGRALAFADDPAWPEIDAVTAGPDAPAPDWLLDGLAAVVTRWRPSWVGFPAAVVAMPSRRRPELVRSLAQRAAEVLGLEVLDLLEQHGPAPEPGLSPAARGRAVAGRLALRPGAVVPSGTLLLVDDTWRTGWTTTIAAALLREAGATAVAPLVAHQLP